MIECERCCVQRLATERGRDLGEQLAARFMTVRDVTDERPTMIGGVHADLMRAAGLEPEAHERGIGPAARRESGPLQIRKLLDHLPVRDRVLAGRDLRRELLALDRMAAVERAQRALFEWWRG